MIVNMTRRVAEDMVFPGATWERIRPEDSGLDPDGVQAAIDYGRSTTALGDETFCVSIHRNGRLVADAYWDGMNYRSTNIIWSTAKAWLATLVGIAEHQGTLSTEDFVSRWIDELQPPHESATVTIDQVLRHDSGRYYDLVTDFATPQFQDDQTVYAIGLRQQHEPGTHNQYNQMAMQLLERVLSLSQGQSVEDFTAQSLYEVLQFESDSFWQVLSFFILTPQRSPLLYGGMTTSCADMGRVGHLWLNKGEWRGTRVFDEAFYDKAMSRPEAPYGQRRRYGNWGTRNDNFRSDGMGAQVMIFNPVTGIVLTRIGWPATTQFSYNTFMDLVDAAVTDRTEDEKLLAAEEWIMA